MVEALKQFKSRILAANAALAQAYSKDAETLRPLQEDVGRLAAKMEGLQNDIARLGLFSSGKKHELEQEIAVLTRRREEVLNRAEDLRMELSEIEPIVNEGFWVEQPLDELMGGLDKIRGVLTAFGSAMTQLTADVSEAQLRDAAAMAVALGKDAAIDQWRALAEAAGRLVDQAAGDLQVPAATAGSD